MTQFYTQQVLLGLAAAGLIKSIQQVSITIGSGASSNTASISAVGSTTSLIYGGFNTTDTGGTSQDFAMCTLTNATTVTADRSVSPATSTTVLLTVVEWSAFAIQSIQQGTIALASVTSNTATISAVTMANAVCLFNGSNKTTNTTTHTDMDVGVALTATTTVTATRGGNATTANVSYCVIEFKPGILSSSSQQVSFATAGDGSTATITSTTMARSMLFWGGYYMTSGAGTVTAYIPRVQLTAATTITMNRGIAGTGNDPIINLSVAEFATQYIKSVNRAAINITGAVSNTATLTAVNTAKTVLSYMGGDENQNAVAPTRYQNVTLTNSTTVTATAGATAGAQSLNTSFEAIEFK